MLKGVLNALLVFSGGILDRVIIRSDFEKSTNSSTKNVVGFLSVDLLVLFCLHIVDVVLKPEYAEIAPFNTEQSNWFQWNKAIGSNAVETRIFYF